jgi:hypothetical protein
MSMNKVNMSLDEIINNSRRNKRPLEVVKGHRGNQRNQNNFSNRKSFNSRNENSRGRFIRGRGRGQGRGGARGGDRGVPRIRRNFNSYTRYNNVENRENNKVHLIR